MVAHPQGESGGEGPLLQGVVKSPEADPQGIRPQTEDRNQSLRSFREEILPSLTTVARKS